MHKIFQIWHQGNEPVGLDFPAFYNRPPKIVISKNDYEYLFFESACIERFVKDEMHHNSIFSGLLSPNYLEKIQGCKRWGKDIANTSKAEITKKTLIQFVDNNCIHSDIISFTTHPIHSVCLFAEKYHPNFYKTMQIVLNRIGYKIDLSEKNTRVVYFNYFVAKPYVLDKFVYELLAPFINACINDDYLFDLVFMRNSNYPKRFLLTQFEIDFYPLAPFLAERLITLFLHKEKQLKFISF